MPGQVVWVLSDASLAGGAADTAVIGADSAELGGCDACESRWAAAAGAANSAEFAGDSAEFAAKPARIAAEAARFAAGPAEAAKDESSGTVRGMMRCNDEGRAQGTARGAPCCRRCRHGLVLSEEKRLAAWRAFSWSCWGREKYLTPYYQNTKSRQKVGQLCWGWAGCKWRGMRGHYFGEEGWGLTRNGRRLGLVHSRPTFWGLSRFSVSGLAMMRSLRIIGDDRSVSQEVRSSGQ